VRVRVTVKGPDRFTQRRTRAERGRVAARTREFARSKRRRHGWQ
jgi:hypothetical protein